MKVLLINPPLLNIITSNVPEFLEKESSDLPPLGLLYLASYLKKYTNHQVKILDCIVERLDYIKLKHRIQQMRPDVIGITALTLTLLDVIETAKIIKAIDPKIKIVLGGPHIHIYPQETMQIKEVDFCVLGEGEKVFKNLLDNIDNPQALSNISGLVFRDNHRIIQTGQNDFIDNLDDLPYPARELTAYQKYYSTLAQHNPVTSMFTSRGCPYKCIFCDRPHLGKVFRARSAQNVVAEMEKIKQLGIQEVLIYDDTFTVDRQRVVDICQELIERKIDLNWDVRARVNTVDEELLRLMKAAGCVRIHYGVEAGTDEILENLRKGITVEMVRKVFKATRRVGIETAAYFMIGNPGEKLVDIKQSIKLAKELEPDYVHFSILTPFPATDIYELGLKNGLIKRDVWQEFAKNPKKNFIPPIWEENLNRVDLINLLKQAYYSFYFRPSYIWQRLKQISSLREFFIKLKIALKMAKI